MARSVTLGLPRHDVLQFDLGDAGADDQEPCRGVPGNVAFRPGRFEGAFAAILVPTEHKSLVGHIKALFATRSGAVPLDTLEGQVSFTAAVDPTGHVNVAGQLMDVACSGNELKYCPGLVTSFLPAAIAGLEVFARGTT